MGMVIMILVMYLLKRVDKRRALAIQGNPNMLSLEQPIPNETALPLPTTIKLHLRMSFFLLPFGLAFLTILIGLLIFAAFSLAHGHFSLLGFSIIIGIFLVTFLFMLGTLSFSLRSRMFYQVDVNEQGITVRHNKITTHMDWNAASLFAVNAVKKPRRPRVYELSNSDTIARWIWIPPNITFFYPLRPTLPFGEYNEQMRALADFVAAKTHLPLYDISEPTVKWYM